MKDHPSGSTSFKRAEVRRAASGILEGDNHELRPRRGEMKLMFIADELKCRNERKRGSQLAIGEVSAFTVNVTRDAPPRVRV